MTKPVYLDNHATTPVDPRVLESMLPYFSTKFGNAASRQHGFGWEAEQAVEDARRKVAELIGAEPKEIIFTSGATESNNLALKGAAEANSEKGNHIVTAATEHKAVLDTCKHLEHDGWRLTYLPVNADGLIDLNLFQASIASATILASVMYANNEIGVVQPMAAIGAICRERGVLLHSDAVQAVGKIPVDVNRDQIDLLSVSAHKIYGPKGVGALYVRRKDPRVKIAAQIDGGGHERGMRSGTLNVPGIVGLGAACAIARAEMAEESERLRALRDRLRASIERLLDGVRVNGSLEHRLPNNLNLSFEGVDSESLLIGLHDVALSTGSACSSATVEPSHVLRALGIGDDRAHGAVRFGLGRFNTEEEMDFVAGRIAAVVEHLRALSPA
jgi:cysteine desulfurase